MKTEIAPSIPAQVWEFLWSIVQPFRDDLAEFFSPIIGPVIELLQEHTWLLFPAGYCALVLVSVVFKMVNWFNLSPEQKAEHRRLEAEAYARAEPERQAKAAKKKAAAAKRQAEDDEDCERLQREYDDYYAHKEQQDAYQASNR